MRNGLSATAIEQIIERVFVRQETMLNDEAQPFDIADLQVVILRLRMSMASLVSTLPDAAFHNRSAGSPIEADWSAGQIVSHNTDRLIWVLRQIEALTDSLRLEVPASLERMARTDPVALTREESLAALQRAAVLLEQLFTSLHPGDAEWAAASEFHGEMGVKGWLLLVAIHDHDHSNQLAGRHQPDI